MSPEEKARLAIDQKLIRSGWVIQDMKHLNLSSAIGVAVREFPTSTGEVDYALFVDGTPIGIVEAKRTESGEKITTVEDQSARYAGSKFKWIKGDTAIRFAYEATDKLTRFTDYHDLKYCSRTVFSFHRPETLRALLSAPDTIRNNMKHFPPFDTTGFRDCQIRAITKLDRSFSENKPRALVQMATGAGKTFTAITAAYRLLKFGKMNRILFLVDTKSLGEQAEREFLAYTPNDDPRPFPDIYGVYRLKSSWMSANTQIYISTIQRMYSILKSEYSREQAIIDGVNVGEDIFLIETEVGQHGGYIVKQQIEYRNRLSREKRWKQMDEDVNYTPSRLDRDIVNPSQIRTVIRAFRKNLYTILFPRRNEVPKTLIFAKTDSHADDIIQIVREEFGEGNEFCKKITYFADDPEGALSDFRNSFNPRIAVTVDMIATGTDVKPIECLIFMRDVRSKNYFEQMKGRGTRTLSKDDLQKVTPSATENKDHFVIVDAVGVTRSKKSDTRALERKPSVSLKELMMNVALGAKDEDTLTSLASRIVRLNAQMTPSERKEFQEITGASAGQTAQALLDAFDPDVIAAHAGVSLPEEGEPTQEQQALLDAAQRELSSAAAAPFHRPEVRDYIENVRRNHEQIIDNVNIDTVLYAGYDVSQEETSSRVIETFREFIQENRDEITALRIIYDQRYKDRPMAIAKLKALYEKLKARNITADRLWDCYAIKQPNKVKRGTVVQLADLVSLIRFETGATDTLVPFAERVSYNFQQWSFRRNAGAVHFTEEQMEWLRLIKDHIAASLSVVLEDLDLSPFDRKGGLGRFYEVFGEDYEKILMELNVELVA